MKRLSGYSKQLRCEYTKRALEHIKNESPQTVRALLQWFAVNVRIPALFNEMDDTKHTLKASAVCAVELLMEKGLTEGLTVKHVRELLEASLTVEETK